MKKTTADKLSDFIILLGQLFGINGFYTVFKGTWRGARQIEVSGSQLDSSVKLRDCLKREWQVQYKSEPSEKILNKVMGTLSSIFWAERSNNFWGLIVATVFRELKKQTGEDLTELRRVVMLCSELSFFRNHKEPEKGICIEDMELSCESIISNTFRKWLEKKYTQKYGEPASKEILRTAMRRIQKICLRNADNEFWPIKVKWAVGFDNAPTNDAKPLLKSSKGSKK